MYCSYTAAQAIYILRVGDMITTSYTAAQAIYILRVGDMITTIFLEYGFTSNNTLRSFSIIACEFDY